METRIKLRKRIIKLLQGEYLDETLYLAMTSLFEIRNTCLHALHSPLGLESRTLISVLGQYLNDELVFEDLLHIYPLHIKHHLHYALLFPGDYRKRCLIQELSEQPLITCQEWPQGEWEIITGLLAYLLGQTATYPGQRASDRLENGSQAERVKTYLKDQEESLLGTYSYPFMEAMFRLMREEAEDVSPR